MKEPGRKDSRMEKARSIINLVPGTKETSMKESAMGGESTTGPIRKCIMKESFSTARCTARGLRSGTTGPSMKASGIITRGMETENSNLQME